MKKVVTIFLLIISVGALAQSKKFTMPQGINQVDFSPKTVVVKFNESQRKYCNKNNVAIPTFNNFLKEIEVISIKKKFKNLEKPKSKSDRYGFKMADLSLIYEFEYASSVSLEKVINYLYSLNIIEYAQPHYVYQISYTPNDPSIGAQNHLSIINAYSAWNVNKGDTAIVVGIVDTGWDSDHEDLQSELKHNYNDPINGFDDDNDGYIDNFNGWDLYDNDNDPEVTAVDHGVHVSGCASASTDNNLGVASPGFNTKLLPVKAGAGLTISYGYEGITYCADHGASVINCSWAGTYGGPLGQDVITYATINKSSLVVAAAGNNNSSVDYFPAAYQYVFSVAATDGVDVKADYSNYSYSVDISAPGDILSTLGNGGYGIKSGTSLASPVVAGSVALVLSEQTNLTALQVGELLKATSDEISSLNASYVDMLGAGRINLGEAMNPVTVSSVDMVDKNITDNADDIFVVGDQLSLSGNFVNYLATTGNLVATISSASPYVNITNNTYAIGVLTMMGVSSNLATPFTADILVGTPLNSPVLFRIDITDGASSWVEYMEVVVNVDYINIEINDVATSITSKGMIGYNVDDQSEGIGFTYLGGNSILWNGSFMLGVSDGRVVDRIIGASGSSGQDFKSYLNVNELGTPVVSEFDVQGVFNDSGATADFIGIEVEHKAFAWTTQGHSKYIIAEYTIKNTSGSELSDMYAGIYCDWDISSDGFGGSDICGTSFSRNLGYVYDPSSGGVYAGIQVLSNNGFRHHAMYKNSADGGGINPNNSYTSAEKYTSLSAYSFNTGGTSGADVSHVVSAGPFTLADGDSVTVAFALLAGDNLADLEAITDSAYMQYNDTTIPNVGVNEAITRAMQLDIYPNPTSGMVTVSFYNNANQIVRLTIYDITGKVARNLINKFTDKGNYNYTFDLSLLDAGIYFYELNTGSNISTKKVTLY